MGSVLLCCGVDEIISMAKAPSSCKMGCTHLVQISGVVGRAKFGLLMPWPRVSAYDNTSVVARDDSGRRCSQSRQGFDWLSHGCVCLLCTSVDAVPGEIALEEACDPDHAHSDSTIADPHHSRLGTVSMFAWSHLYLSVSHPPGHSLYSNFVL